MIEQTERAKFTLIIKDLEREDYGFAALNDLIALGAEVEPHHYNQYDKHFITVTLPEGFSLSEEKPFGAFKKRDIIDDKENNRGSVCIKVDNMSISNIILFQKYNIYNKQYSSGQFRFSNIYFGTDDEELIPGGVVALNSVHTSTLYTESRIAELKKSCASMADELYPDWRSPLAYWDDELTLSDASVLSRKKEK